ncbi:HAD family hydrolase [Indiicoccus explosivorum]|uniref:HAD family hydrolase n=1 Tax=Indiicoccus explosivorum TaxID=1917864 RepID=UPI000B433C63|nr:HAD family hydrolase [Indiicoccus explosivorum]
MLKAIFFDLDDTLLWDKKSVKDAFAATCKAAEERCGADAARLEAAVREEAASLYASYETYPFTQMIGINPFEGLWGEFPEAHAEFPAMNKIMPVYRKEAWTRGLGRLGIEDEALGRELAERFPAERRKRPVLYGESVRVLERLKGRYQLLLVTNGSPDLQHIKLNLSSELLPYFSHIIVSGEFGKGKPDPAIFGFALEKAGIRRHEALMVGDNLMTDILGASRAGIRTVWVNREGKEPTDVVPDFEIRRLEELLPIAEALDGPA